MKKILLILGIFALLSGQPALAGTACSEKVLESQTIQKAFRLAIKTRDALDASGAQVAIVGRVGQDLSKYGLRFSHAGIIWRDNPKGRWLMTHELNQCGTANSALFNEGLANFFFDDMFAWDTLIAIPSPTLQAAIVEKLRDSEHMLTLHEPRYNMVAYPYSTKYQNSNQWVLEFIADARMTKNITSDSKNSLQQPNRATIQTWLKQSGYQPTALQIPALQRLGGRMFRANVAFDDHPMGDRMAGKIEVVTVDSIVDFLKKSDPETRIQTLSLETSSLKD